MLFLFLFFCSHIAASILNRWLNEVKSSNQNYWKEIMFFFFVFLHSCLFFCVFCMNVSCSDWFAWRIAIHESRTCKQKIDDINSLFLSLMLCFLYIFFSICVFFFVFCISSNRRRTMKPLSARNHCNRWANQLRTAYCEFYSRLSFCSRSFFLECFVFLF